MKSLIIALMLLCVVIVGGSIIYLNQHKVPPTPVPVVETSSEQTPPEKTIVKQQSQMAVSSNADKPSQVPVTTPAMNETKSNEATNAIGKLVDALLTAKSAGQKHELFEQLRKSGQLNEVIAELKQRMAQNPGDVEIPTTLGEAQLNQVRALHEAGADNNEVGILAMQADQSFNAALKLDPQNWEANFVKAASMYYWPADAARDNDVVQRLSGLIDQQETMPSQSEFVQTYLVLGNEYQKIGQPDKALATWQLGLTKFPGNPALQGKVNGQ